MITRDALAKLVSYNPDTGEFIWRSRLDKPRWSGRYAGKRAGALMMSGYRSLSVENRRYYEHRLAYLYVYGILPKMNSIDHINGNRADNRIANLRLASKSQNSANSKIKAQSATRLKGAFRNGSGYCSRIKVNGKQIYLGQFRTPEEAHAAYAEAAEKHFGEYARAA